MTLFSVPAGGGSTRVVIGVGSKDGLGGGDHDQPYTFCRRPRTLAPFPFSQRQFARLLALRSSIGDGVRASDDLEAAGLAVVEPASNTATSHPRLCYPCDTCGALVGGAYQSEEVVSCPRCAGDGDRDRVARAILWTAGLLGPRTS